MPASFEVEVPVGVITGLLPVPDFWKTIGSVSVPVAVMAGGLSLKVAPAETLKVTPPAPTPLVFKALMAAVKVL